MPRGLISELEKAAAEAHNLPPLEVSKLLDRAIDMARELRRQMPKDSTSRGVVSYLRIASERAARSSEEETVHALLDAADALRILLAKQT